MIKELPLKGGSHRLVPLPGRDEVFALRVQDLMRANNRHRLAQAALQRTAEEVAAAREALGEVSARVRA